MYRITISLIAALLACGMSVASAQTPPTGSNAEESTTPGLDLSTAQRQTLFQSVSKTQKNNAAPTGFRPAVGVHVPDGIETDPLPGTLATLIPQARGFEVAMVEKQVVLVDPKSKIVRAVVTGE